MDVRPKTKRRLQAMLPQDPREGGGVGPEVRKRALDLTQENEAGGKTMK